MKALKWLFDGFMCGCAIILLMAFWFTLGSLIGQDHWTSIAYTLGLAISMLMGGVALVWPTLRECFAETRDSLKAMEDVDSGLTMGWPDRYRK